MYQHVDEEQLTGTKLLLHKIAWVRFAFCEGLLKATGKSLSKFFGGYLNAIMFSNKTAGTFVLLLIQSCVQMFGGLILALVNKKVIFPARSLIFGSVLFGIVASFMSFLSLYTFTYPGNDLTVATFLITLSIIPSRLIDRIIFKEKIRLRQYFGLSLYILIAYIFLRDFKSPNSILLMPPWAWMSLAIGFLLSINNLITRKIKATNGFVHNFWIGLTTATISIFAITFFKGWNLFQLIEINILLIVLIHGIVVLLMILAKISAFKAGASLTFEVFIQQSAYLVLVTIIGISFFDESFTMGKLIGIPGFIIAFSIANQEVWEFILKKIKK